MDHEFPSQWYPGESGVPTVREEQNDGAYDGVCVSVSVSVVVGSVWTVPVVSLVVTRVPTPRHASNPFLTSTEEGDTLVPILVPSVTVSLQSLDEEWGQGTVWGTIL